MPSEFAKRLFAGSCLCAALADQAAAMEFLEKRNCTVGKPSRTPIHTQCVISGGIQGGVIDVSIKTPDGKRYTLEGPIDGEEGHKFLLQHRPASKAAEDSRGQCYIGNDGQLELCIGKTVTDRVEGIASTDKSAFTGRRSVPDSAAPGCFIRDYDKSHLAGHPNQLITNVRLAVRNSNGASAYPFEFALQVQMRGRSEILKTVGMCKEQGTLRLHCFVECDGGGLDISIRRDSVLMYLDRIRMAACVSDVQDIEKAVEISGGVDDREFRVDRVDPSRCSN